MRNKALIIPFYLLLVFGLNKCGIGKSASEAELVADQFYKHLQNHDYEKIIPLLDEEALAASPEEEWMSVLKQKEAMGEMKSFRKNIGFNTKINNGITKVYLRYTCEYEGGKLYDRIVLIKRKKDFKIYNYEYNKNKNALSRDE